MAQRILVGKLHPEFIIRAYRKADRLNMSLSDYLEILIANDLGEKGLPMSLRPGCLVSDKQVKKYRDYMAERAERRKGERTDDSN